jgi:hypothetical protein
MSYLNPEQAQAMAGVFKDMDAAQATQWKARNTAAVQAFAGLLQLPPDQRRAAIQQNAADYVQLGYTPQQIAGFNPTDANIRQEIAKHTDADHIMDMVNPHFENMRANGAVSESQPYGPTSVVAQSPLLQGPHGSLYANTPMTATNPKTGQRIQSLDGGKTWQPLGGQTPPASGGFQ